MIRRKKMTIFTDAKENTTVLELKKIIEGKENFFFLFQFSTNVVSVKTKISCLFS